jgi:uncharacterized protein (TIGR03435 family)
MLTATDLRARRVRGALRLITGALVIAVGLAQSQTETTTPKFDLVSIRPCRNGDVGPGRGEGGGVLSSPSGLLLINCETVGSLIPQAYLNDAERAVLNPRFVRILQRPLKGGPPWIHSDLYSIEAKAEGAPSAEMMMGSMLKALLEDRFKLKVHRETSEIPVYALVVAEGGPKKLNMTREGSCIPVDRDHPFPRPAPGQVPPDVCGMVNVTNAGYDTYGQTMQGLCLDFSTRLGQEVIDKTGMKGMFDIHLDMPRSSLIPGLPADGTPDPIVSAPDPDEIFSLIETAVHALGLKLERTRGSDELLVIDHVERPSGN